MSYNITDKTQTRFKTMKYKYDTHIHSLEASACGKNGIREMVQAYHKAGYTGFIVTDHFIHGNTAIPRELPWKNRMQMYYNVYLQANEEGDKLDFDVFFGIEHYYEKAREILVYGINLDFLLSHPELETADIDTFARTVHEAGGILIHAHPYRQRSYIPADFQARIDLCDGIEVYNAHDTWEYNKLALADALALKKFPFSGGDMHRIDDPTIGNAGIVLNKRVNSMSEFIKSIQASDYIVLIDGKEYSSIELQKLSSLNLSP